MSHQCVETPNGPICASHPYVVCPPPAKPICSSYGGCYCPPIKPVTCEIKIEAPITAPYEAILVSSTPRCDAASIELAIAVVLAKLLGRP